MISGVSIKAQDKEALKNLRDMRNRLIHFGTAASEEATMSMIASAVHVILDFIHTAFPKRVLTGKRATALKAIRKTGAGCLAYVEARWNRIRDNVEKAVAKQAIIRCARCHQEAALFTKSGISCLFCKYKGSDIDEFLAANVRRPRIFAGAVGTVETGCCDDHVFKMEWRDVTGTLLELEQICFSCGKRLHREVHHGLGF